MQGSIDDIIDATMKDETHKDARALFETLRFAMREAKMSNGMARVIFDRAIHELPHSWTVKLMSPNAHRALLDNDCDRKAAKIERAHSRCRNDWQLELLRCLRDEDLAFEEWTARLLEYDQVVLTTRKENRENKTLSEEFLGVCIRVPEGLFVAQGHSGWALRHPERQWLLGLVAEH